MHHERFLILNSALCGSPSRVTIPLLYIKSQDTIEDQAHLENAYSAAAGPSDLNHWTGGDLISIEMLQMIHPQFGTMVFHNQNFWDHEFDCLRFGDYTRADGVKALAGWPDIRESSFWTLI